VSTGTFVTPSARRGVPRLTGNTSALSVTGLSPILVRHDFLQFIIRTKPRKNALFIKHSPLSGTITETGLPLPVKRWASFVVFCEGGVFDE
jgi:hypothetical protein